MKSNTAYQNKQEQTLHTEAREHEYFANTVKVSPVSWNHNLAKTFSQAIAKPLDVLFGEEGNNQGVRE